MDEENTGRGPNRRERGLGSIALALLFSAGTIAITALALLAFTSFWPMTPPVNIAEEAQAPRVQIATLGERRPISARLSIDEPGQLTVQVSSDADSTVRACLIADAGLQPIGGESVGALASPSGGSVAIVPIRPGSAPTFSYAYDPSTAEARSSGFIVEKLPEVAPASSPLPSLPPEAYADGDPEVALREPASLAVEYVFSWERSPLEGLAVECASPLPSELGASAATWNSDGAARPWVEFRDGGSTMLHSVFWVLIAALSGVLELSMIFALALVRRKEG